MATKIEIDAKINKQGPFCGFCGQYEKEVNYLIAGPITCICDECVSLMVEIIRDERDPNFCLEKCPRT